MSYLGILAFLILRGRTRRGLAARRGLASGEIRGRPRGDPGEGGSGWERSDVFGQLLCDPGGRARAWTRCGKTSPATESARRRDVRHVRGAAAALYCDDTEDTCSASGFTAGAGDRVMLGHSGAGRARLLRARGQGSGHLQTMDPFSGVSHFWDISQQPNTFSALPDDDFLAFLEKQFPTAIGATPAPFDGLPDVVDPQSLTRLPHPNPSPPSSDSSPSPSSMNNEHSPSRRQSGVFNDSPTAEPEEAGLKRKASEESIAGEPSHKAQHTNGTSNNSNGHNKKGSISAANSRRKSSGNPTQDESRLLKRKEQNRAAQRAFRERKEKHVKDLEDKVAALEAKNQMTESENENLRDLLSRLQSENMMLKQQATFTFSMPRENAPNMANGTPASGSFNGGAPHFNFASPGAGPSRSPVSSPQSQSSLNFNSLISFDPNMMNVSDEPTATEGAMNLDFGFGQPHCQYKTIAANPMFMSFAEPSPYDSPSSGSNTSSNSNYLGNFDMTPFESWSPPSEAGLDQLFGGNFIGTQNGVDFNALLKSPPSSISPVSHASLRTPSSSSPSSSSSPGSGTTCGTPGDECPKTKEDLAKHIANQGNSAFACEVPIAPYLRKAVADETGGAMIMCKGSSFPPTEKSDKNVEVLTAWRSITSNPQFKVRPPLDVQSCGDAHASAFKQDLDINELCAEFTSKARCDGTKVVLEPQGVHHIIETLAAKRQQQAKQ
ncbi:hypothetical protein POSPLADRAFT_1043220 [Postia placenta MAD-698-R-SB12]|uniref:BZIP domain-containing protein n=1 Tax=Postia placenta MAD-698-R-SB12 TaxID=670580 RepID=A0A1X6NHZ7_9APHY|nr:hypothetical protein POSPLADRAFT_1043220 [Postia placenta MAD-698-R-SB12]OSX68066.1 hypothetical protein POSPLADRAFT_1043220 [Postia placenta MAD-698-R-SB12]